MEKREIIRILKEYKEKNREKYAINRIGIFGSCARDMMTEQSDIDVVVELDKPDLFFMIGIKQDLEASFQRSVDVIRYRAGMGRFLKKRIKKEAVYV